MSSGLEKCNNTATDVEEYDVRCAKQFRTRRRVVCTVRLCWRASPRTIFISMTTRTGGDSGTFLLNSPMRRMNVPMAFRSSSSISLGARKARRSSAIPARPVR
ncbi:hypothetical protein HBI25_218810 [Parastagonospora nodorum]|nr:hypothetical protein HBH52_225610 [Parastagonospora nodorum]KAH4043581.1 hypothetical protein HBH49_232220 [Parastagonospora nodorum]KAH4089076.1 hypothetical protein HBH46_192960 [Parastagonospora nodorum]KAH4251955.1 hypothetical protein HBI03_218670 [Parastagonospora nodorum]KAH4258797.1 hypothetical protein HBI04_216980 [Parastagonospora nodorum]